MNIGDAEQLEKAKLEDALISLLYGRYGDIVFHGGTAIWRCYFGNRFSRDLDFYFDAGRKEKEVCYREISDFLKESGFTIKSKGYNNLTDTMHFLVESEAKMKLDLNFKYKKGIPVEYTKIDSSKMIVLSLTPQELLNEKIDAYNDKLHGDQERRQTEVQDLYDIYFLTGIIKGKETKIAKRLSVLMKEIESSPPANLRSLGHLILEGIPPTFELMVKKINEWLNDDQ